MPNSHILEFQTTHQDTVPGFWTLTPGRVLSLQPLQAGLLRVAQGQVWATVDTPHQGAGNASGDHFLRAGEQLSVRRGQHLVLESLVRTGPPVYFEWTPTPESTRMAVGPNARAVTRPLRDLGFALGMVGNALAHLSAGLVTYGRQRLFGRHGAVQPQQCS